MVFISLPEMSCWGNSYAQRVCSSLVFLRLIQRHFPPTSRFLLRPQTPHSLTNGGRPSDFDISRVCQSERFARAWSLLGETYKRSVTLPRKVIAFSKGR
jgi:hypothetical protein